MLLDVVMPEMDGYEVCRRLREDPATRLLPVIMITASGDQEKVRALEAGADDFIQKPLDQAELLARVRSLLRIKQYQDELAELNRTLESRVQQQVEDLERVGRLKRFLSPQVVELVISGGEASLLETHRSEITAVFCDLRGFTAFSETVEPEEVIVVLREYHEVIARLVSRFGATLDHIAGDGILVYLQRPAPLSRPAGAGDSDGAGHARGDRSTRPLLAANGDTSSTSASESLSAMRPSAPSGRRDCSTTHRSARSRTLPRVSPTRPKRARSSSAPAFMRRPRI